MNLREPVLKPVPIETLRPTQITVGYREVAEKRRNFHNKQIEDGNVYLGKHMIPVLLGPKARPYVIDHHHLALALIQDGVTEVLITVVADLRRLSRDEFWVLADNKGWCHPYDAEGRRRAFADIPTSIDKLKDDPFRSLAGELRRAGGFAKDTTPFSEFIWADFLRRRIKRTVVEDRFQRALERALALARSEEANHLPGWAGPIAD